MFEYERQGTTRLHGVAFGIGLAIVVASLIPVPADASTAAAVASPVGVDKLAHAGGYAVFAAAVAAARTARTRRALAAVVLLAFALGLAVEFLQLGVPTRTFSVADAVANGVGAVAGAAFWRTYFRR